MPKQQSSRKRSRSSVAEASPSKSRQVEEEDKTPTQEDTPQQTPIINDALSSDSFIGFDDVKALKPLKARIGVAGGRNGMTEIMLRPVETVVNPEMASQSPKSKGRGKGESVKVVGWHGTYKGIKVTLDGQEGDIYCCGVVNVMLPVKMQ